MTQEENTPTRVRITDVDMPFWSMVVFMVKWAIASIPALVILAILGVALAAVLGGVGSALVSGRLTSDNQDAAAQATIDSILNAPLGGGSSTGPSWIVSESKNPIDDSPTVILSLDAISPTGSRFESSPALILRCQSNRTEVYIRWNDYLGLEETKVTLRLGRAQARTADWGISTDNRATFYPGNASALIRELVSTDTLVARTTPYSESPVTATFVLADLEQKVAPLRTACRW